MEIERGGNCVDYICVFGCMCTRGQSFIFYGPISSFTSLIMGTEHIIFYEA